MKWNNGLAVLGLALMLFIACKPTSAQEGGDPSENSDGTPPSGLNLFQDKQQEKANQSLNWHSRFTFEGQLRSGPYTLDPHIWVYTNKFSERFGMPKQWINEELRGVEAAAWRQSKTGYITCGWGGRKDACREEYAAVLELYFDTRSVELPWAPWSRESDVQSMYVWANSQGFLVPKACELRRENSNSPVGNRGEKCQGISQQPLADSDTKDEIFFFVKSSTYKSQGNFKPVYAYDKRTYPDLAWFQIGYTRPVGLFKQPEAALLTMESRTAPLGKTLRKYHEIFLPADFDRRIKTVMDFERETQQKFYKKTLDIN